MRLWTAVCVTAFLAYFTAMPVSASCQSDQWTTAFSSALADLNQQPPATVDAGTTLNGLQTHPPTPAEPTALITPITDDLNATPPNLGDAKQRLQAALDLQQSAAGACLIDSSSANNSLHNVYSSPALAHLDQTSNNSFFQNIGNAVINFFKSLINHVPAKWWLAILLVAAAAMITVLIWRLRQSGGGRKGAAVVEPLASADPEVEWRAAEAAAAKQDYREAVRRAFRSALLDVAINGRLAVDASWTNRELLARATGDSQLIASLAPAAHIFELSWYSGTPTNQAAWTTERDRCLAIKKLDKKAVAVQDGGAD